MITTYESEKAEKQQLLDDLQQENESLRNENQKHTTEKKRVRFFLFQNAGVFSLFRTTTISPIFGHAL